jgi:F0F1-type ATP synthase assembly protein I
MHKECQVADGPLIALAVASAKAGLMEEIRNFRDCYFSFCRADIDDPSEWSFAVIEDMVDDEFSLRAFVWFDSIGREIWLKQIKSKPHLFFSPVAVGLSIGWLTTIIFPRFMSANWFYWSVMCAVVLGFGYKVCFVKRAVSNVMQEIRDEYALAQFEWSLKRLQKRHKDVKFRNLEDLLTWSFIDNKLKHFRDDVSAVEGFDINHFFTEVSAVAD